MTISKLDEFEQDNYFLFNKDIDKEFQSIDAIATRKKDMMTPESLSKLWGIGIKTAKRTLAATSHQCIRELSTLTRCFQTDMVHMQYKQLATREGRFYVDMLFTKIQSICGYTCGNLYTTTTLGFFKFFPMETSTGGECASKLQTVLKMVGTPPSIHSAGAKDFVKGAFVKKAKNNN